MGQTGVCSPCESALSCWSAGCTSAWGSGRTSGCAALTGGPAGRDAARREGRLVTRVVTGGCSTTVQWPLLVTATSLGPSSSALSALSASAAGAGTVANGTSGTSVSATSA